MQLSDLLLAAKISIPDPRRGFRMMSSLRLDRSTLLIALAAITFLGVVPAELMARLLDSRGEPPLFVPGGSPFGLAALQLGVGLLSALAIHRVGGLFKGTASFDDALLVVVWMQFILTLLQFAQLLALVVLPPLAGYLGLIAMLMVFWLATGFIAEAHGFRSQGLTFVGMLVSMVVIIFALAVLLVILGFTPEMPDV